MKLHPTKGLNPHLTYCPRCGGIGPELILLGLHDYTIECNECDTVNIGGGAKCGQCGARPLLGERREIGEHDRLPGSLCGPCEAESKQYDEIVKAGGVYWKCADCKRSGVIKADAEFARAARSEHNIEAPLPLGVLFTKNNCPSCGPRPAVAVI